jgi:hypothetical protein
MHGNSINNLKSGGEGVSKSSGNLETEAREFAKSERFFFSVNSEKAIKLAVAFARQQLGQAYEDAAQVAESERNLDPIGSSTGNAYGTQKKIAAAIRARAKEVCRKEERCQKN